MVSIVRICVGFAVFAFAVLASTLAHAELNATSIQFIAEKAGTRVDIEFNADPQIQPRLLANPHRLVLDLPETLFVFDKPSPPEGSIIASFRAGLIQQGRSRMILALKGPFEFAAPEVTPSVDGRHVVFSLMVKPTEESLFKQALSDQLLSTASTTDDKGDRVVTQESTAEQPYTVVIDAGHGGIDGGATGVHGTIEKEVTLDFANELAEILRIDSNIRVVLTRTDDHFIALDERVKIARQINGDLFISIHADTIADKSLRGATVYTLSDKASDQVAQAVASQENLADAIGGVDPSVEDHAVADILIDLTRRETMQYSVAFARKVVSVLTGKTKLINNSHRSAGFRVLRAADIPSVLVELGYLSNEEDEKLIKDKQWRKMVAAELASAIRTHVSAAQLARQ